MSIKKLLQFFGLSASLVFCGLVFADNDSSKNNSVVTRACRNTGKLETTRKIVALTFDDGPHEKYTGEILDILQQNNVKATFFVVGKNAKRYPNIIKKIYMSGHVIANHTYSHNDLTMLSDDEIETEITMASRVVYKIIDEYPMLFRPPYGACSTKTAKVVCGLGFRTIAWSDVANDYDIKITYEKIANNIIDNVQPGAIIVLHDGGGKREKTVKALSIIINALRDKGYEFLTIPELLGIEAYRGKTCL